VSWNAGKAGGILPSMNERILSRHREKESPCGLEAEGALDDEAIESTESGGGSFKERTDAITNQHGHLIPTFPPPWPQ
jgi:hypothetical protein